MRKKSVLLASVGLAVLAGLAGTLVVQAQYGAQENPPHAVARALTEEELAAGEEMEVHYFDSFEEAMEFIDADPADFQPATAGSPVSSFAPSALGSTKNEIVDPKIPALTQQCTSGDYEIQGVTGNDGAIPFYGVWGYARIWDPTVKANSDYVNSVWTAKDSLNILEVGWFESPDGTGRFFRVWYINGVYHEDPWGSPPSGSDHDFKVYNVNGDKVWRYYVDGVHRTPDISTNFDKGTTAAMRERHNSCDSGWAHWWNPKRCDFACNFSLWQTIAERNYDSDWYLNTISNHEFYVNLR